jgi:hypothetical protein
LWGQERGRLYNGEMLSFVDWISYIFKVHKNILFGFKPCLTFLKIYRDSTVLKLFHCKVPQGKREWGWGLESKPESTHDKHTF